MVKENLVKATYHVSLMEDGATWLHAPGSDFLFAYLDPSYDATTKIALTNAFNDALQMSNKIKAAVLTTSGQTVVDGLYLLDQPAMTKAMNSIPGMGMTGANTQDQSGSGTATGINNQFFSAILGGLGGDVTPMQIYLQKSMGNVIAQTSRETITKQFGIVIGLISLMPVLNVPVTSFQYVYSAAATSTWVSKVLCVNSEHYTYDYSYTVVNYNYDPLPSA